MKSKIIITILGLSLLTSLYAKDSGFYIGGLIGKSKTKDYGVEYDSPTGITNGYTQTVRNVDSTYGALVGYDLYFDKFLVGLELDINKKNSEEKAVAQEGGAGAWFYRSKIDKVSSLKLRLGYLANDNNLIYLSYGRAKADITGKMYGVNNITLLGEFNSNVYGDQYSMGMEHFFENNLSLQFDVKRINYDQIVFYADDGASYRKEYQHLRERAFTLALKYKF